MTSGTHKNGFTLLEIMIVVAIIGLMASLALPSFMRARRDASVSAIANDFRVFDEAFQMYAMETGGFPGPDWVSGAYPTGMGVEWLTEAWIQAPPVGGDWVFHVTPSGESLIILHRSDIAPQIMQAVDELMDDGDLVIGAIRGDDQSLDYYIE